MPPPLAHVEPASGSARRPRGAALALLVVVAASWVGVLLAPDTMGLGPLAWIAAWTLMMTAMMLPSAAPLVLLYRRGAGPWSTAGLAAGYLAVWAAAGVPALVAEAVLPATVAPAALAAAGAYQLTPWKDACLRRCRGPADFLIQRWGRGAFRLGMEHGLWCLGCCWALMAVLVVAGAMGLAWVVAIAGIVALEKLAAGGVAWSRATGGAFLIAAFTMVVL